MNNGDFSEALKGILNDPEALSGVMKIAKNMMGQKPENSEEEDGDIREEEVLKKEETINRKESPPKTEYSNENRTKLLYALKPYLNESRREKIDYILNIMKMIHLASDMNLLQMLKGDN